MKKTLYFMAAILLFGAAGTAGTAFAEPVDSRQRVTNADFPTQLRPEPDSFRSLAKIPPATAVKVLDMRVIQLDKFKENWYKVEYDGATGWVRGDDLAGEESERKYSVTYQAPDLPSASPGGLSF